MDENSQQRSGGQWEVRGVTQAMLTRRGEGLEGTCWVGQPGSHLLREETQPSDQFELCRERSPSL